MPLRVTFDTNVLDKACRPERFPKDPSQPLMIKIHEAIKNGHIEGFYSVTMLTIEGIMRTDRAEVFANTRLERRPEATTVTKNSDLPDEIRKLVGDADVETIPLTLQAKQPRKPLHPEVIARMKAAKALGVRVLEEPPRIGAFHFSDPHGEYYLSRGNDAQITEWNDKALAVSGAIEARGLGIAQVKAMGAGIDADVVWFKALDKAKDIHERRAIERAFSEWADAESLAAHVAYGLDVFCSADAGKSNATKSIFDPENRAWATATYGVKFMTFEELAAALP